MHTFSPNTQIQSSQVNENFAGLADGTEIESSAITTDKLADDAVTNEKGGVPSNVICMWAGTIANIPSGWYLCSGDNGTPNLLDRFVMSVPNDTTDPGDTGGAHTKDLSHTHTVSAHSHSIGSHRHRVDSHSHTVSSHTHGNGSLMARIKISSDHVEIARVTGGSSTTLGRRGKHSGMDDSGGTSTEGADITGSTAAASPGTSSSSPYTSYTSPSCGNSSPGTDSKLSSSQDIRPKYYKLAFIMKS